MNVLMLIIRDALLARAVRVDGVNNGVPVFVRNVGNLLSVRRPRGSIVSCRIVRDPHLSRAVRIHDEELIKPRNAGFENNLLPVRRREGLPCVDVGELVSERHVRALGERKCYESRQEEKESEQSRTPTLATTVNGHCEIRRDNRKNVTKRTSRCDDYRPYA